jgi:hypothetical protein
MWYGSYTAKTAVHMTEELNVIGQNAYAAGDRKISAWSCGEF